MLSLQPAHGKAPMPTQSAALSRRGAARGWQRRPFAAHAMAQPDRCAECSTSGSDLEASGRTGTSRRDLLCLGTGLALSGLAVSGPADAFEPVGYYTTPSGLRLLDIRVGDGPAPKPYSTVVVHWTAWAKGWQNQLIEDTRRRNDPYIFRLGSGETIKGFEEAVLTMRVGGHRRVELLGSLPELGYPLERKKRFVPQFASYERRVFRYRLGPQPYDQKGQEVLEYVLNNASFKSKERTLMFDIRLVGINEFKLKTEEA